MNLDTEVNSLGLSSREELRLTYECHEQQTEQQHGGEHGGEHSREHCEALSRGQAPSPRVTAAWQGLRRSPGPCSRVRVPSCKTQRSKRLQEVRLSSGSWGHREGREFGAGMFRSLGSREGRAHPATACPLKAWEMCCHQEPSRVPESGNLSL